MAKIVSLDPQFKASGSADQAPAAINRSLSRIALIGNFPPRRCGIATFTVDTRDALATEKRDLNVDVYAMDDGQTAGELAQNITPIRQNRAEDYMDAARQINGSGAEIVWLQHEFGIFGGRDGELILQLVSQITAPLAITLHTILENPSHNQRRIMETLIARSDLIIVMAEKGREILRRRYGAPADKINVIPHGIPDRPYVIPNIVKPDFGFEDRAVILTFGLLSPEKGIGDMIEAMPEILNVCPNALYVVLGATHPHIMANSGNALREGLQARVAALGITDNVRFVDEFVDLDLLTQYLQAADVYVTPYHNPDQITSGTLSYAVGLGKPVVSTAYVHAKELLSDGTGVLVPFHAPAELAKAVSMLLTNDGLRDQMARRAYRVGRTMTWQRYAAAALEAFYQVAQTNAATTLQSQPDAEPVVGVTALERLTDSTGMLQHSRFGVADRNHGYCIDDNARALALVSLAHDIPRPTRSRLSHVYAAFIQNAWNPDIGAFRNFMGFDRHWLEDQGSSDSNGRTLWALAVAAVHNEDPMIREWANELYRESSERLMKFESPRATAFSLLAAIEMQRGGLASEFTMATIARCAQDLIGKLRSTRCDGWNWFESVLAYDNCRLPEALILAGAALADKAMVEEALAALDWLMRMQSPVEGWFRPVGSTSFGNAYAKPQRFDQQPVEALAAIDACIAALAQDPADKWAEWAEAAFSWFSGDNDLGVSLVDQASGECCDGLTPEGRNANRGAESVLAWQAASRRILRARQIMPIKERIPEKAQC